DPVVLGEQRAKPILQHTARHNVQTQLVVADGFVEGNAALVISFQFGEAEFHKLRQHRQGDGARVKIQKFPLQFAAVEHSGFRGASGVANDDVFNLTAAELAGSIEVGHHVQVIERKDHHRDADAL